ncbi:flotillin-like FloA family protein [Bacteroidota bacterium]
MEYTFIVIIVVAFIFLYLFLYLIPIGLWFQALVSGVQISLLQLIFMKWRKVPPQLIVKMLITGVKAGISLKRYELEALYLAGGDVQKVVFAMISAEKTGKELSFEDAVAAEFNRNDVKKIIEKYQLEPHPEGGYYCEIYRSDQEVKSFANRENRNAVTHIYFLLKEGQVSRFHKVLHDEIWNFYEGSPLKLIEFDGDNIKETILGQENGTYVSVVKGGVFQAAETTGIYTLVGCSVAPGFDFKDFSFLDDEPQLLSNLKNQFPDYQHLY